MRIGSAPSSARATGPLAEADRTSRPLVIAHRGASAYRPENTLPAYELAVEQGADMIEIDLHTTRDGAIAIAHDAELERLGGTGEIADVSAEELRKLDAGGGECIPMLEEVLDRFADRIPFNLEIKRKTRGLYDGIEAAALDAVRRRGGLDRVLFSSFYDPVLEALRWLEPRARLGVLVDPRFPERTLERARAVDAEAINPHFAIAEPGLIEGAHAEGFAVYVYTVDEEEAMRRLLDRGVDGLFTNRPDRMRALLEGRGRIP
jgi:glycerophosphoryl diester phosphodiesterase